MITNAVLLFPSCDMECFCVFLDERFTEETILDLARIAKSLGSSFLMGQKLFAAATGYAVARKWIRIDGNKPVSLVKHFASAYVKDYCLKKDQPRPDDFVEHCVQTANIEVNNWRKGVIYTVCIDDGHVGVFSANREEPYLDMIGEASLDETEAYLNFAAEKAS